MEQAKVVNLVICLLISTGAFGAIIFVVLASIPVANGKYNCGLTI